MKLKWHTIATAQLHNDVFDVGVYLADDSSLFVQIKGSQSNKK